LGCLYYRKWQNLINKIICLISISCYTPRIDLLSIFSYWLIDISAKFGFKNVSDWEDFESISGEIKPTDLVVVNLSRKGSVSYQSIFDKLPTKFEKYFDSNNVMLVYPQDDRKESAMDAYEDFTASPLAKGIEAIEQVGRGLGSILKKS